MGSSRKRARPNPPTPDVTTKTIPETEATPDGQRGEVSRPTSASATDDNPGNATSSVGQTTVVPERTRKTGSIAKQVGFIGGGRVAKRMEVSAVC